jgi:hypothetical protein
VPLIAANTMGSGKLYTRLAGALACFAQFLAIRCVRIKITIEPSKAGKNPASRLLIKQR